MKLLKYILFFLFSLLLNRNVSATEIVVIENKNVFFEISHNQTISKEDTWLSLLYLQENSKLVTYNDKSSLSFKQNFSSAKAESINAREIFSTGSESVKINTANLEEYNDFISVAGMEKSKLIYSFGNTKDAQKWIDLKSTSGKFNIVYNGFKNELPFSQKYWTAEHKTSIWKNH